MTRRLTLQNPQLSVPGIHADNEQLKNAEPKQGGYDHNWSFNLNSGTETADSADFTDFEEVIADERTNLFVAKLQGIDNRNLLYPCNLRNLWLNPFSVFGLKRQ